MISHSFVTFNEPQRHIDFLIFFEIFVLGGFRLIGRGGVGLDLRVFLSDSGIHLEQFCDK
jgi:hypothetical protein